MKVSELKQAIADLPDDMEVILQKDAEGNGYSPLSGADADAVYRPDSTWSGEVYDTNWSAGDAAMDDDVWESLKKQPRCLVLHPVN